MRRSAPPFLNPCYFGTDVDSRENLIACSHTIPEIAQIIGVDSLGYLSTDSVTKLAECGEGFCTGCFTGNIPLRCRKIRQSSALNADSAKRNDAARVPLR